MSDSLRMHVQPELDDPAVVLAFEGWNDAGDAASTAVRYVAEAIQSVPLADFDLEPFLDLTVRRPEVRFTEGSIRTIDWPRFEFRYGVAGQEQALVFGVGPEPHFQWRQWVARVCELIQGLGARRVVLLGSYLADVLYSRPVRVAGFAHDNAVLEKLGVEPSAYEGPTGIVAVLAAELQKAGIEVVSLWSGLPHYIQAGPNSRGALALLQTLIRHLGVKIDEQPLRDEAARFENEISAMVAADPALTAYVKDLKRREFVS